MRYVIAGSSGFLGRYFCGVLRGRGDEVVEISRGGGGVCWEDGEGLVGALEGADVVLNFAGKSVNCRYTARNREEIIYSRTETTDRLGEAMGRCEVAPRVWLNASTATIYRHAEDRGMDEESGEIGEGFSVEVAKLWERRFFGWDLGRTRCVAMRTAIVLGLEGGAFPVMLRMVRLGLGGAQGKGTQKVSWIHVDDVVAAVDFLVGNEGCVGVYNLVAPGVTDNRTLMARIREKWGVGVGLPAWRCVMGIGAWLMGTEAELVLKSRWVLPGRLLREGFVFRYGEIGEALDDLRGKDV